MSLDIYLKVTMPTTVYTTNITHNLGAMAKAAGIYTALWRPEKGGYTLARHLITPLRAGLAALEADPEKFRAFDAENRWGTYEQFVPFVRKYLAACEENPNAEVRVSR